MDFKTLVEGKVAAKAQPSPNEKLNAQIEEFMNRASVHDNHSNHHDQLENKELAKAHKNVSLAYKGLIDTHYKQIKAIAASKQKEAAIAKNTKAGGKK